MATKTNENEHCFTFKFNTLSEYRGGSRTKWLLFWKWIYSVVGVTNYRPNPIMAPKMSTIFCITTSRNRRRFVSVRSNMNVFFNMSNGERSNNADINDHKAYFRTENNILQNIAQPLLPTNDPAYDVSNQSTSYTIGLI